PAGAAEVVVHHAVAEAVAGERLEPGELSEVGARDVARRHDRAPADADRAVAAHAARELLAREREPHRPAVAASAVGLAPSRQRYISPRASRAASVIRLWSHGGSKVRFTSTSRTPGVPSTLRRTSSTSIGPTPQ